MSAFQPSVLEDSVLVVDDDQATRESLASVLKGAGIEVFVASDPTEALTLHGLQHPAAVVVDHQLADHTGVELARRLKEEDPDTPVLLLTGLASLDSALAAVGTSRRAARQAPRSPGLRADRAQRPRRNGRWRSRTTAWAGSSKR